MILKNTEVPARVYLTRKICEKDFSFLLDYHFTHNPLSDTVINIIDKAFRDWSALTGLIFKLERDSAGNPAYVEWNNFQGKYVIAPRDSGAMTTFNNIQKVTIDSDNYLYCAAGGAGFVASTISININPQENSEPFQWNYDTLTTITVPPGEASFYQAFMHEIGHLLLLDHVNNSSDLMYYSMTGNAPIVFPNNTNVVAVQDNIAASQAINWAAAIPSQPPLYPPVAKQPHITLLNFDSPLICSKGYPVLSSNYPTGNLWSTGATTQTIQVSSSGTYWLQITDDVCALADTIVITLSNLYASFDVTNVACHGDSTGAIITNVTGAHPPFTYHWTGNGINADTQNISNLTAGTYYFTLSNSVGCTQNNTLSVSQPEPLEVTIFLYKAMPPSSPFYKAEVTGGTPPYQYEWYLYSILQGVQCAPITGNTNLPSILTSVETATCKLELRVTDANNCEITGRPASKSKNLLSNFAHNENNEITLIPNPTTGSFNISNISNATIHVYSSLGSFIKTFEHVSSQESINISHLSNGIYFLKIVEGDRVKNEKLVLSK